MSDADLSTTVAGMTLANPVLTAAGCGGSGRELDPFFDLTAIAGMVTRSIWLDPRSGTATPRMAETPSGMLSAVGMQGPGVDGFLATELPWLAQRRVRVVVSVAGATLGEYAELARRVGNSPGVAAVEVNLPVPNDPYHATKVLNVVRRDVPRGMPVLAKLSPETTDIVDVARAVVEAGADALVMVNTPPGLTIDPATLRPALGAVTGGLSGPAIRPMALRCVWDVHRAMPDVAIIGVGGIRTGYDALEFLLAGAGAVQVGSVIFHDPTAPVRIVDELRAELAARGIRQVADVIGRAHRPKGEAL